MAVIDFSLKFEFVGPLHGKILDTSLQIDLQVRTLKVEVSFNSMISVYCTMYILFRIYLFMLFYYLSFLGGGGLLQNNQNLCCLHSVSCFPVGYLGLPYFPAYLSNWLEYVRDKAVFCEELTDVYSKMSDVRTQN